MPECAQIIVHQSQWPDRLATQLVESLESRRIHHKLHYESPKQVRRWLRLHEALSPARRDPNVREAYRQAFKAAVDQLSADPIQLVGLGCGGGQKEADFLKLLVHGQHPVSYTAVDVSPGMVITALQNAWTQLEPDRCSGLVCDLAGGQEIGSLFKSQLRGGSRRIFTFFGMIPNFEPGRLGSILEQIVAPGDLLLCSANLAPGTDYRAGVEKVLPQYDNAPTRDWLFTLLHDLGVEFEDGRITFEIEDCPDNSGALRITATFLFDRDRVVSVEGKELSFAQGDTLRLFFSYRHSLHTLARLFERSSLKPLGSWISVSGEEGVFVFQRI